MGPLRRRGQPRRTIHLPPWRDQEAKCRYRNVGGLQESWPSAYFDGPQWYGGWKHVENFHFRCGGLNGGGGKIGEKPKKRGVLCINFHPQKTESREGWQPTCHKVQ